MEDVREYWSQKRDSDHSLREGVDVFEIGAGEVMAFFDPTRFKSVLEIGCGAGELFEHFKLDRNHYLGVDFSASMLEEFSRRHPKARVLQGDATTFLILEKFDFILINNVIQYCSPDDTRACLTNLKEMLSPNGIILMGNVPNKFLRYIYELGMLSDQSLSLSRLLWNACKSVVRPVIGRRSGIGYWHKMSDIRIFAAALGLDSYFFGALLYPYRFSVIMKHDAPAKLTRSRSVDLVSES